MRRTRNRDKSYLIILFACLASATAIACGSIYLNSLDDEDYTTNKSKYEKEELLLEKETSGADENPSQITNNDVITDEDNAEADDSADDNLSSNDSDTTNPVADTNSNNLHDINEDGNPSSKNNTTESNHDNNPQNTNTENTKNEDTHSDDNSTAQVNASTVLPFGTDQTLYWPVEGSILMEYNMTNTVYFPTLDSYKCNPALIIQADVDMPVSSCCESIVQEIGTNEEIGKYVTVSLGDGYALTYGQLGNINVEEGQQVTHGDIIGYVSEPTHYYKKEGCNLYLKLTKDDEPVDPLNYLSYPQESEE